MHALWDAIGGLCRREPIREKILIMPSYHAGHELLDSVAQAGYSSNNLSVSTVFAQAEAIALPELEKRNLSRVEPGQVTAMIEKILPALRAAGSIDIFPPYSPNRRWER